MHLWLKPEQAQELAAYARAAQPNECCGVILGRGEAVEQVVPIPNVASEPKYNYHMDEKALLKVLYEAEHKQREVIGFYHSHPRTEPIPSPTDTKLANYPDAAYMIVGLRNGEARLAAWSIKRSQVAPIKLIISADKPVVETAQLTIVQKRAIIASAIIAFIFMLVLSLSLLPPAPIIPLH
ncbi:MAG: M67 family metallopeptidase [Anaerolineae bacterium]|nr:M67 family metallopeptidase [Anaerolineae bacterium]